MDAPAQRRELRQRLAEQRRALPPTERINAAQGLRRSLEQLPEYFTDQRVAGYWASHGELPLNLVIPPLASRGQQFLLPVTGPGRQLRFAAWNPGEAVEANRYGIPEPAQPCELFEPFQRLHVVEQGAGHGLGLAIAQAVAMRHGGQIHGQSAPGAGTVFTFEWPAPPAGDA